MRTKRSWLATIPSRTTREDIGGGPRVSHANSCLSGMSRALVACLDGRFVYYETICIARRRGSDAMKILVVDDHALIRDTIRGVLAELLEEALVLEAPDGEHGLRDHRPHLSGDYLRFIEQTAKGRLPCRIHHGGSAPQPCLRRA